MNVNPYNKQMDKVDKLQGTKKQDKIEISTEALELQKGSQFEIERQEKVAELKSKIESGEYKVNPEEVARNMYSYWDDLKK